MVKPSDEKQVVKLRNSFIEIAKKEREDSKDRDANFMPEVRKDVNKAINGRLRGLSVDLQPSRPPRSSKTCTQKSNSN